MAPGDSGCKALCRCMPAGSLAARSGHLEPFSFLDNHQSWVESANQPDTDFPLQNLPFGVFRKSRSLAISAAIGVAIGDRILDLGGTAKAGLLDDLPPETANACSSPVLNPLMALGCGHWSGLRERLGELLRAGSRHQTAVEPLLVPMSEAVMAPPAHIGDYT